MRSNQMQLFLKDQYSNDPIINFLQYWMDERGDREVNDLDCLYFDGDLCADTLFSVWTPLKFVLDYLNPNESFYKKNRYGDPHKYLRRIKAHIDEFLPKEDKLVAELYKFAALAELRGNYFRWPCREINDQRYDDYDQVPPTLFKCFPGEKYGRYFQNDEKKLRTWLQDEKLEMLFSGDSLRKEDIKPLINGMTPREAKWLHKYNEILEMLQNYVALLSERQRWFE